MAAIMMPSAVRFNCFESAIPYKLQNPATAALRDCGSAEVAHKTAALLLNHKCMQNTEIHWQTNDLTNKPATIRTVKQTNTHKKTNNGTDEHVGIRVIN
jgi:hypothetical protein